MPAVGRRPLLRSNTDLPIGTGGGNLTGQMVVLGTDVRGDILLADLEKRDYETLERATHPGGVRAIDISPDERIVASGGIEGQIHLWDVQSGELASSPLQGHSEAVTGLFFGPKGEQLFSADGTGRQLLWRQLDADPQALPLPGYSEGVLTARFTFDGQLLVTGHMDGAIVIRNLEAIGAAGLSVERIRGGVTSLAFNPDGDRLALATLDEEFELRAAADLDLLTNWEVEFVPPQTLEFSPDGSSLAAGDDNGNVTVWEVMTGEVIQSIEGAHNGPITNLAFPNGSSLMSITGGQVSQVWDLDSGSAIGELAEGPQAEFFSRAFLSPDGRFAARGTVRGPVFLWDPTTGETLGEPLTGPTLPIAGIAFHPTETVLAGGGCAEGDVTTQICQEGEVWLWDWRTGEPVGEPLQGIPGAVNGVAFGPEGRLLAGVSATAEESGPFVWDTETRELLAEPIAVGSELEQTAFSADGEHIAVMSGNLDAFLWRYKDRAGVATDQIPEPVKDQISIACRRAGRNLTQQEWQQYFPGEPYEETCPQADS